MKGLLVALLVVVACGIARADDRTAPPSGGAAGRGLAPTVDGGAVALLPLDADAKLELYGQPVASEVARALVAGGIDVVVVGPKMAVPERARLIVDGKISAGKGDAVVVALRVRDRDTGSVLDSLSATAVALTSIDQAAADVSARVLPAVRTRLAARAQKLAPPPLDKPPAPVAKPPPVAKPAAPLTPVLVGIGGAEPLRAALAEVTVAWLAERHREPRAVPLAQLDGPFALPALAKALVPTGVTLEVLDFAVEPPLDATHVPLARARVHVRIADTGRVVFDRVIVTDTIVGERGQPTTALAERCAREVLAILAPNALRAVPELAAP